VLLYDSKHFMLAKPKALNDQERLGLAERNFTNWFDSASKFWRGSRDYGVRQWLKEGAFLLHTDRRQSGEERPLSSPTQSRFRRSLPWPWHQNHV